MVKEVTDDSLNEMLSGIQQVNGEWAKENRQLFGDRDITDWQEWKSWKKMLEEKVGPPIDPGILRTCVDLNLLKFYTINSCEGHLNWGRPYPWVRVEFESWEHYLDLIKTIGRFCQQVILVQDNERDEKIAGIEINFCPDPWLFGFWDNYATKFCPQVANQRLFRRWRTIAIDAVFSATDIRCLTLDYSRAILERFDILVERIIMKQRDGVIP